MTEIATHLPPPTPEEQEARMSLQDTVLLKEIDPMAEGGVPETPSEEQADEAPLQVEEDELDFGDGQLFKLPRAKVKELAVTGARIEQLRGQIEQEWQALQANKKGYEGYQSFVEWISNASPAQVAAFQQLVAGGQIPTQPDAPQPKPQQQLSELEQLLASMEEQDAVEDAEEQDDLDLDLGEEEEEEVAPRARGRSKPKPKTKAADKTALVMKALYGEVKALRDENRRILEEQQARIIAEQQNTQRAKIRAFHDSIRDNILASTILNELPIREAIEDVKQAMRLHKTNDVRVAIGFAEKKYNRVGRKMSKQAVADTSVARKANGVVPSGGTAPGPVQTKKKVSFEDPDWTKYFLEALGNSR